MKIKRKFLFFFPVGQRASQRSDANSMAQIAVVFAISACTRRHPNVEVHGPNGIREWQKKHQSLGNHLPSASDGCAIRIGKVHSSCPFGPIPAAIGARQGQSQCGQPGGTACERGIAAIDGFEQQWKRFIWPWLCE